MGNVLPIDGEKKGKIEEIAKDFMSTFGTEYVLAYGVEFTKMKLKQIDDETYEMNDGKKELMYREKKELTDPHKMGILTKKGAIIRNWKKRYFIVNPDYTVNYYDSEEAYHKGGKPKGVIQLAGYKVEENANSAGVERLQALMKTLGCSEKDLPTPHKYPDHTLELMHERRRAFYTTAADEDDKKEWVEMFRTCCRMANGFKNKDPLAQAAFKIAYVRACQKSGWFRRSGDCGGTEEQVLSETIAEIINHRIMSNVYSELSGNFTIRKKLREQALKVLDSLVLGMVTPAYKALVESIQSLKEPLESTVDEKKAEIVVVQKKITEEMSDKLGKIVNATVQETTADMKKMFEELKELAGRTSLEMKKECVLRLLERLISETSESKDVDSLMKEHFKKFDKVALSAWAWDHWHKVWNIEKESLDIITKYKDSFDQCGQYSSAYKSHDMLSHVADAAFYTFEECLTERTKETEILKENDKAAEFMESVKNEIISKYDADSTATPEDISFTQTTMVVLEYVTKKIDPLTKDIRKIAANVIPDALQKIVSVDDRYELYVEECVKELIRKAVGIVRVEGRTNQEEKQVEEKTRKEESEEMKVEGENEEKSPKDEMKENSEATEGKMEGEKVEGNEGDEMEKPEVQGEMKERSEGTEEMEREKTEETGVKVEGTDVEGDKEEKPKEQEEEKPKEQEEEKPKEQEEEKPKEQQEETTGNTEGTEEKREGKCEETTKETEGEKNEGEKTEETGEKQDNAEEVEEEEKAEETASEETTTETGKKENSEKTESETNEIPEGVTTPM